MGQVAMVQNNGTQHLSLREAARAVGLTKSTVLRAIQNGKLSSTRDENGNHQIAVSELFRFRPAAPSRNSANNSATGQFAPPDAAGNAPPENVEITTKLALAEQQIQSLKEMLDEIKKQRDSWQEVANKNATLLLTYRDHKPSFIKRLLGAA
jgi:excisionase family DNA binding protein